MKVSELRSVLENVPDDTEVYSHVASAGPGIPEVSFMVKKAYVDAPSPDTDAAVIIELEA